MFTPLLRSAQGITVRVRLGRLNGRCPPQVVRFAAADRDALAVEVLEQRLGVLSRGAELVAQLAERDRAGGRSELYYAGTDVREHVRVVVKCLGYAHGSPGVAQGGEVGWV
jgi:hypothetical protein